LLEGAAEERRRRRRRKGKVFISEEMRGYL